MEINLNRILNHNHLELFQYTGEELLVYGGAGGGKSYSIADKILLNYYWQPESKIYGLVIRKTLPSNKATCVEIMKERANSLQIPFQLNRSEWIARCGNMTIDFLSLNNKEDFNKLKSRTNIDFIWLNELLELREADYEECLRRLRGGQSSYQQIMSDFNPSDEFSWVNVRFFQKNIGNARKIRYNVQDNHPDYLVTEKAQNYIARLERLKEYDMNAYNIYRLGLWGVLEGVIFDWDIVSRPLNEDEIFYGGDFGYSVDPTAVVQIYRKSNEFWLEEILYDTELTNPKIVEKLKRKDIDVKNNTFYWDSAEPKSIQELCDNDMNAIPAIKGPDSVRAGIDYLKGNCKIHIIEGSENLVKERKSYCWAKDKDGRSIRGKPIEFNNHLIDATRYAIFTHCKHMGGFAGFGTESIY